MGRSVGGSVKKMHLLSALTELNIAKPAGLLIE